MFTVKHCFFVIELIRNKLIFRYSEYRTALWLIENDGMTRSVARKNLRGLLVYIINITGVLSNK